MKVFASSLIGFLFYSSSLVWAYCPTCEEDDGSSPVLCDQCDQLMSADPYDSDSEDGD
ncbi:MAG: hypothetical protein OXE99_11185 [Cellvibrionales bacterium]|nr:hypothetical protein [Cellvibrionales bacterium]